MIVAAVGVFCTNTRLHVMVCATRGVVDLTAVSIAAAALIRFQGAQIVPPSAAAERVLSANTVLKFLVLAADGVVLHAARPLAIAAIQRTGNAILTKLGLTLAVAATLAAVAWAGITRLVAIALTVAAFSTTAVTATQRLDFIGAKTVPLGVAAVGVLGAHANLHVLIVAAGVTVGLAAVAVA